MAEGRNSITVGSIHHDNDTDEPKGDQNNQNQALMQSSYSNTGGADSSNRYRTSEIESSAQESYYLTIDERCKVSGIDTLLRRFIVRVVRGSRDAELEMPTVVHPNQALCVWPNCLCLTDER